MKGGTRARERASALDTGALLRANSPRTRERGGAGRVSRCQGAGARRDGEDTCPSHFPPRMHLAPEDRPAGSFIHTPCVRGDGREGGRGGEGRLGCDTRDCFGESLHV